MKLLTAIALVCFSLASFAKNVELQIEMIRKTKNETQSAKMKVIAELGKSFEIPYDNEKSFKLKMTATDKFTIPAEIRNQHKGKKIYSDLMISGEVFRQENGKDVIIAKPLIISNYKQEAMIEVGDDKEETFEMKITPTLQL